MDSSTDNDLLSLKIKLFCENRYFAAGVEYHNDATNKCRVPHVSDAEDWIRIEEINGIEVMLMD